MSVPEVLPVGLRIEIRKQGTTSMVEFTGEWDLGDREAVGDAVAQALEEAPECVVLDLRSSGCSRSAV
jgi:hypothetical protein